MAGTTRGRRIGGERGRSVGSRRLLPRGRTASQTLANSFDVPDDAMMEPTSSAGSNRRVLVAALAALVGSQGCYHYAPVQVAELAPGTSVRMELSAVAVDRLRRGSDSVAKL